MNLSDVPSEAIRQAVADAKECDSDPRYTLDMRQWHMPRDDGTCHVCLAGAVIAQRTDVSPERIRAPSLVKNDGDATKLFGLDDFRVGNVRGGLSSFGVADRIVEQWSCRLFSENIPRLLAELLVLANDLEIEGL